MPASSSKQVARATPKGLAPPALCLISTEAQVSLVKRPPLCINRGETYARNSLSPPKTLFRGEPHVCMVYRPP